MANNPNLSQLRVIFDLKTRNPGLNIALEEAIAKHVKKNHQPPSLRFWRNGLAIIVGRSQRITDEVNVNRCTRTEVPIIRRSSGGGTVLHHPGNYNYSVYLPRPKIKKIDESLHRWNNLLAETLKQRGLKTAVIRNSLSVEGRKISGSAQSRRWGLLHHGTLLVREDNQAGNMENYLKAMGNNYSPSPNSVASKPSPVIHLNKLSTSTFDIQAKDLFDGWIDTISNYLGIKAFRGKLSNSELRTARKLAKSKYKTRSWNVERKTATHT